MGKRTFFRRIVLAACSRKAHREESGAILVLAALLTLVLVMFAALVIDLSLFSNSVEQSQHFARLAALAALEQHFASPTGTSQDRVAAALTRAREVAQKNFMLSDPSRTAELGVAGGGSGGAILIPGRYYFAKPCDEPTDPECEPCPGGNYPCFRDVDLGEEPNAKITAYRVQGPLYSGISTRFARAVFGIESFPVSVRATATVRPRQICALVDTSGSMTLETHPSPGGALPAQQAANPEAGHGSYFGFVTKAKNPSEPDMQDQYWNYLQTAIARPTTEAAWEDFLPGGNIDDVTEADYQRMHFKDDYREITTLGSNGDYSQVNPDLFYDPATHPLFESQRYVVDIDKYRTGTPPDPTFPAYSYRGAEPLRTVFAGLHRAVDFFNRRRVAGDKMCIIFYNRTLAWNRYIKLTDDFPALLELTDFENMDSMTNGGTPNGFERIVRQGMLPLGVAAGYTNSYQALSQALTELSEGNPQGGYASNALIVIGDGLTNCVRCPAVPPTPRPPAMAGCDGSQSYWCTNFFDAHDQAQRDLISWSAQNLVSRNIPINWIMVGGAVQPHTLMMKSNTGQCVTDKEARQLNVPMVRGGYNLNGVEVTTSCKNACATDSSTASCLDCRSAFDSMSPTHPFYDPNTYAYELAVGTKGLWGPIRPQAPGCSNGTFSVDCSSSAPTGNWQTAQRLQYDPQCRTPQEQIESYMDEIIGGNPYTLVEVEQH